VFDLERLRIELKTVHKIAYRTLNLLFLVVFSRLPEVPKIGEPIFLRRGPCGGGNPAEIKTLGLVDSEPRIGVATLQDGTPYRTIIYGVTFETTKGFSLTCTTFGGNTMYITPRYVAEDKIGGKDEPLPRAEGQV